MGKFIEKQNTQIAALVLISAVAFARSLNIEFLGDDLNHIEGVRESLTDLGFHYFRFLAILTLLIDKGIWGYHHAGYHLTNGLMHTANVLLVYLLALNFIRSRVFAFGAAILFLLHPIHSSSVFWISGRVDVLCTTFYLMALLAFTKYLSKLSRNYLVLSCILFLLALLSKEMALSLPFVLTVYVLVNETASFKTGWKNAITKTWPFWTMAILFVCFRLATAGVAGVTGNVHTNMAPLHLLKDLATFIGLLIVPGGHIEIANYLKGHTAVFTALAVFIFISLVIAARLLSKDKNLWFLTLFLLLSLMPVIRLVMRWYLYLPSVAFFLVLAYLIWKLTERKVRTKKLGMAFMVVFAVTYAYFLNVELNRWLHSGELSQKVAQQIAEKISKDNVQLCLILSVPGEFQETPVLMHGLETLVNYRLRTDFNYSNHAEVLTASLISIRNSPSGFLPKIDRIDHNNFLLSLKDSESYFVFPELLSVTSGKESIVPDYQIEHSSFDVLVLEVNRFGMPDIIQVKLLDSTLPLYKLTLDGLDRL